MGQASDIGAALAALTILAPGLHPASAQEEEPDLDALLEDIPLWEQSLNLRLGAGFNDNLLLSDLNQESSPMLASGFDLALFRLPLDGRHFNFFASLDDRRYPDGDQVRNEQTVLTMAQARRDFTAAWIGGVTGQYFYQNQVVDVSVTEADATTLPVRGHQLVAATDWRWRSPSVWWLEAEATGERQLFEEDLLDDYWEYGPRLSAGWNYRYESDVELGYELARRDYDSREAYSVSGQPQAGTDLSFHAHDLELAWRHHFDEPRRWRLFTRLGWGRNEDNGSGYFDFDRWFASTQLRFRREPWEVRAQARVAWYDYAVQTSDTDPGELRERVLTTLQLRLEREISAAVRLVLEYDFEQATSNLSFDSYTANVTWLGIDWEL